MTELNKFFKDGFSEGESLPTLIYMRYLAEISATRFEQEGLERSVNADWESDLPSENNCIPEPYLDLMNMVCCQSAIARWFQIRFGPFSRTNVMLQKSLKGHEMDWHFDGFDPMHLVCLIYFTRKEWDEKDGGQLQIGEADCNDMGLIDEQASVKLIQSISPAPGKVVWTLNTDPRKVHRVAKVLCDDDERIVLIGQFGYAENAEKSTVSKWLTGWE